MRLLKVPTPENRNRSRIAISANTAILVCWMTIMIALIVKVEVHIRRLVIHSVELFNPLPLGMKSKTVPLSVHHCLSGAGIRENAQVSGSQGLLDSGTRIFALETTSRSCYCEFGTATCQLRLENALELFHSLLRSGIRRSIFSLGLEHQSLESAVGWG
jgi:hypothetical protein